MSLCVCVHTHPTVCLQVLERGGPYPQVILPEFGGYWIEDPDAAPPTPPPTSTEIKEGEKNEGGLRREDEQLPGDYGYHLEEISEAARAYRKHFLGRVRLKWKLTGSTLWSCLLYLMLPVCLFFSPRKSAKYQRELELKSDSNSLCPCLQEHLNFSCSSSSLGNLLLSVRHEEEKEQESLHVIIRYTHMHTHTHFLKDLHMIQDSG